MGKYLLIIDGSSLLSTQYYGNMPPSIRFEADEEKERNYIQNFFKQKMENTLMVYLDFLECCLTF